MRGLFIFAVIGVLVAAIARQERDERLLTEASNLVIDGVDVVQLTNFTGREVFKSRVIALNSEAFIHRNLTC